MSGRTQHRQKAGRDHASNPTRIYKRRLPDVVPGEFDFKVRLTRPEKKSGERVLDLGPAVTAVSWEDESEVRSGTLSLKRADPLDSLDSPVHRFHRIQLTAKWQGQSFIVWEMRVDGEPTVSLSTGEVEVSLTDDLWALQRNKRDWKFRKNKKHKKGWKADDITQAVCKKEKVRIGKLAQCKALIDKMEKEDASGLEIIKAAYEEERKETGVKFVIKFRDGKLFVLPFKRGKVLYEIGGFAKEASPERKPRKERPNTVIEATGRVGRRKKTKKQTIRVFDRDSVRRFGMSTKEEDYGRVKDRAQLKRKAQRDLAKELKIDHTATLMIPGVPFLERNDIVVWRTQEPGWSGSTKKGHRRAVCFITGLRHTLTPESYDTEVAVTQVDPFLEDQERRDKEKRERAREKRNG